MRTELFVAGPASAQHLRRALVPQLALRGRQVAVDRVSHERVHERQRVLVLDDLGAGEYGERRRSVRLRDLGEGRHRRQRSAVAEHRRRPCHSRDLPR